MLDVLALILVTAAAPSVTVDTPTADDLDENTLPPAITMSLEDAVALALHANFDIRTAWLERIAQRYTIYVAEDKFRPHYNATAAAGDVWSRGPLTVQSSPGALVALDPHAEILLPTGTLLTADLQLQYSSPPQVGSQPWSSAGSEPWGASLVIGAAQPLLQNLGLEINQASVDVAILQEGVNKLTLKANLITIISSVITTYRACQQASLLLEIAKKAVSRARELLDINYQMVAAGRIARADLIQVQSDIATRQVNQVNAENNYMSQQLALLQLLALRSDAPIAPTSESVDEAHVLTADQARSLSLKNRPEYVAGLLNKEIALKNLLIAQNNRRWDLQLAAQYRRGGIVDNGAQMLIEPIPGASESAFVGLNLTIPLITVTLDQQVLDADVALAQSDVAIEAAKNSISLDVETAVRSLDYKRRVFVLARQSRELAKKTVENEREKLSAGRSSTFVVLRFQDDLVNAEVGEIRASIDYLNAVTTLNAKVGTLLDPWHVAIH